MKMKIPPIIKNKGYWVILCLGVFIFGSCKEKNKNESVDVNKETPKNTVMEKALKKAAFDTIINGKSVQLYFLKNGDLQMAMTNHGGRIVGLWTPDKNGKMTDVVVGMDNIKAYIQSTEPYFGATIGRVGNRIAKGKFTLDGKEYSIPTNNNGNALHGGYKGFQDVVWDAEQPNEHTLVLQYASPDMEKGFPGNLNTTVTYSLTKDSTVRMEYEATSDKATIVNLTNHAFFNLNGEGSGDILGHSLQLYANEYTPVDEGLIPTGELVEVKGTPFDFTSPHKIGERIEFNNEQLENGKGYDHNYVLNVTKDSGLKLKHAATVKGDKSGIVMDVYTEEPGLQFYSGNFMESKNTFKSGAKDHFRTAFCLETQHFPDAPNQPNFPSIQLNPGETYKTVSEYKFESW